MDAVETRRPGVRLALIGGEPIPGTLVEMLYRSEKAETLFAVYEKGAVRYEPTFPAGQNEAFVPYSPNNNLIRNRVVLFPSRATEYESENILIEEIRAFIHCYVDVSPLFETIAIYYVLLSWVYEDFNELPYLRIRGDFGSGKTRKERNFREDLFLRFG